MHEPATTGRPLNFFILLYLLRDDAEYFVARVVTGGGVGSELVGICDDGHLLAKRIIHIHERAYVAEHNAGRLELCGVLGLVEFLDNAGCCGEDGRHGDLAQAVLLKLGGDIVGPLDELRSGEMRAADEAELRLRYFYLST